MEMNGEKMIKKAQKVNKKILISYLICIVVIIGAALLIGYREENLTTEAIDFTTNGAIGMQTDQYAYLKIEGLSDVVAIYGNTENAKDSSNDQYCIAISGGYLYIVDLTNELLDELKDIQDNTYGEYEGEGDPEPITVYGMTEEIPSQLKEYVLEYYNEGIEEENQIPEEEFEQYFGDVLLNARKRPDDLYVEDVVITIAVFAIFVTIIIHIAEKIKIGRTKKYLKKNNYEEDLAQQLDDFVEEKHYNEKVILTRDFFVDIKNGFTAFKYSDVKWLHVHNVKYYGVLTVSSDIVVHLKDGKTHFQCVEIKGNTTEEFLGIFNKICEKVPVDTLKGYTTENIKAFKEYKKELKENG